MREIRYIDESLKRFNLDLSNRVVFTEAATGHFKWTAPLALMAQAKKVYALAKDSPYGNRDQAAEATQAAADCGTGSERLEIVYGYDHIGKADIVTNLGFVRPINRDVVRQLKPTAVIPLMWETWEFRPRDLDLNACFEHRIMVLGTNERHPDLNFLDYVGLIALKLLFEAQVEIGRSRILVVGGAQFGSSVCEALNRNGSQVKVFCRHDHRTQSLTPHWGGDSLRSETAENFLRHADALVAADHLGEDWIIGHNGRLRVERLLTLNTDLKIVHISGLIDQPGLAACGYQVFPAVIARSPKTMSTTTGYLGPRPVIELHAAGLKVGQEMASARVGCRDFRQAKRMALKNSLCMDFSAEQLKPMGLE